MEGGPCPLFGWSRAHSAPGSPHYGFCTRTLAPAVSRSYADCLSSMRMARSLGQGASTARAVPPWAVPLCAPRALPWALLWAWELARQLSWGALPWCLGRALPWALPWVLPWVPPWPRALPWVQPWAPSWALWGNLSVLGRKGESASYAGSVGRSSIIFSLEVVYHFFAPGGGCACFIGFFNRKYVFKRPSGD